MDEFSSPEALQDTASNKFDTVRWCGDGWTVEDLKTMYDYVAVYDDLEIYPKEPFQANYTGKTAMYQFQLHVLPDKQRYVVAQRQWTDEQMAALAPYCQCKYHQYAWYNPVRFFTCTICCGCVGTIHHASDDNIKTALTAFQKKMEILNL